jgi:AcrR family transcriptional regulator
MSSVRRRGLEDSGTRTLLVAAANALLGEEGVSGVTARRVAQKVGLSHQIVHYYFKSMDELLIAVVEQGTARAVAQLEAALSSEDPLAVVAELNGALASVALSTEFNLYAGSRPALRAAVGGALDRVRAAQTEVVAQHLQRAGLGLPPPVATMVLTNVLRAMALERPIGVTQGHAETLAWLRDLLAAPGLGEGTGAPGR